MDPMIQPSMQVGEQAPEFSLPDLAGRKHAPSEYRGQIVIVNFWSAECPWARRTDQELAAYLPSWEPQVVSIAIASNANERLGLLQQVAADRQIPLVLHDEDQQVADRYGAQTTPHLFLVDTEGILRYQGAFDDVTFRKRTPTRKYLTEAVEALLAGRDPDPAQTPPYGCALVRYAI